MRRATRLLAAALLAGPALAGAALPALATPCAGHIAALTRRLDSLGAIRIAGLEPGHSIATGSFRSLRQPPAGLPSDPHFISTRENIVAARTLITEAATEDRDGNQRACENILSDAKRLIGALP
ncbi:hypothetical protein [Methylobacterium sp. ID0610]|uniref:hypothetical protein n=1 Tax=Methylobacterium carpenticola TaxID=3344827 RepID=UPI0036A5847E